MEQKNTRVKCLCIFCRGLKEVKDINTGYTSMCHVCRGEGYVYYDREVSLDAQT